MCRYYGVHIQVPIGSHIHVVYISLLLSGVSEILYNLVHSEAAYYHTQDLGLTIALT